MRADGVISTAAGLASDSHVCWVYDDPACFADAGRRYLADGLARGDRLLAVGAGAIDAVLADAAPLSGVADLLRRDALRTMPVDDAYLATGALDPEWQYRFYAGATSEALADGYTGLRVLAEVTDLAVDPGRRAVMLRWEHLADDFMASGSGMSALCAYRRGGGGADAAAELESVHPLVHTPGEVTPFRLFFQGDRLAIAGVVDAFGADRLLHTLTTSHVRDRDVTLDLGRLEFVDGRGCTVLARFASRLGEAAHDLRVVGAPPIFRHVWQVLGYDTLANTTVTGGPA